MTIKDDVFLTALGPDDPDDGDDGRQLRGMAIAALVHINKNRLGYQVPSQSGKGTYIVNFEEGSFCTCPDFEVRQQPCKHIYAVEIVIRREEIQDGSVVEKKSMRVRYSQNWPAYNAAQINEKTHFMTFLRYLCDMITEPEHTTGRPRLPLSDMLFCIALKVYAGMSGRRSISYFQDAFDKNLLSKVPSVTSLYRYMENPDMSPLLKTLIQQSALPLESVESHFAVDSTGFSTSTYDRWFDHKWGKVKKKAQWIKLHLMCGIYTNIVTSADVGESASADSPYLVPLLNDTAQGFSITEVSADKAYLSKKNLWAVHAVGAQPYVDFKKNSTGGKGKQRDELWERIFHYYNLHREEFMRHYHMRSNVESTMWMIKSKFGGHVRSNTYEAQVNECLAKVLCHNIYVLIQSTYKLGIEPIFDPATFGAKELVAPKVARE